MSYWDLLLITATGCLVATLPPAVLIHLRPRIEAYTPLRGRWLSPFLWVFASLSFMTLITFLAMSPTH
ncbi:MAG: hypothetical protein K0Q72_1419 [Armatimonadetes bacterium]|jgi:hypothetical protein|nr:hypothetical protein [Armatimonadota bacterium]